MWTANTLHNESDVEQKFLYPLLSSHQGLGYSSGDIRTKKFLASAEIGKRKSTRSFYPDYLVYSDGLPTLVVEAKPPTESLDEAYRECRLYASEINAKFPAGINPIGHYLITNGLEVAWGAVDTRDPMGLFACHFVSVGSDALERLQQGLSPEALLPRSKDARKKLQTGTVESPISQANARQYADDRLKPNTFSRALEPYIRRYLAKAHARDSLEILERAYVKSNERTHYASSLENFLRDTRSLSKFPEATPVNTSQRSSNNEHLVVPDTRRATEGTTLSLVAGGVGSGKSIFVDRLVSRFKNSKLGSGARAWLLVDFNLSPEQPEGFGNWMHEQVRDWFRCRLVEEGRDPDSYVELKKLFGNAIARKKSIMMGGLGGMTNEEFERHIRSLVSGWVEDPKLYSQAVYEHVAGSAGERFVVIVDNCDKRSSPAQLAAFQESMAFAEKFHCDLIYVLRDTTYDLYQNTPPLDAVSKHNIYWIDPPRLINVINKRLKLLIEHLEQELPKELSYTISNGSEVHYSRDRLPEFIYRIRDDVLNAGDNVQSLLESLAGRNIRRALEMFTSLITSAYIAPEQVGVTATTASLIRPQQVVRTLMRGEHQLYRDRGPRSYIHNIFNFDPDSATANNFLLVELLAHLVERIDEPGSLGVRGFFLIEEVLAAPELAGFTRSDLLWALNFCVDHQLLELEGDPSLEEWTLQSHVKASASGYAHLELLPTSLEYIENVSIDAPIRGDRFLLPIAESVSRIVRATKPSYGQIRASAKLFLEYLNSTHHVHRTCQLMERNRLGCDDRVTTKLEELGPQVGYIWKAGDEPDPAEQKPFDVPSCFLKAAGLPVAEQEEASDRASPNLATRRSTRPRTSTKKPPKADQQPGLFEV